MLKHAHELIVLELFVWWIWHPLHWYVTFYPDVHCCWNLYSSERQLLCGALRMNEYGSHLNADRVLCWTVFTKFGRQEGVIILQCTRVFSFLWRPSAPPACPWLEWPGRSIPPLSLGQMKCPPPGLGWRRLWPSWHPQDRWAGSHGLSPKLWK